MPVDLSKISTEQANPLTSNLDRLTPLEFTTLSHQEDLAIFQAIGKVLPQIAAVIEASVQALRSGARLFYLGAGTSGRLGVLDASEAVPTFGIEENRIIGIIAGGERALRHAIEGIEDNEEAAMEDLLAHQFTSQDILIGVTASGRTPYVHAGLAYAHGLGAYTALISCSALREAYPYITTSIEAIVGAELLTGSTRLKSGTAQKIILNQISTGSMIQLGKVYKNFMVDLQPLNEKLVMRQQNILYQTTQASPSAIEQALQESKGDTKLAILILKAHLKMHEAKTLLNTHQGHLSSALKSIGIND